MSQEAEYYIRNLSYGEARDLARRIAQQERAAAERSAHDALRRETQRLEGRMRGEISGLRNEFNRRHDHLREQIECNRRLAEALRTRMDQQGEALAEHTRALAVLAEHDRELAAQLVEVGRFTEELAARQRVTERRLQSEIEARRTERERHGGSLIEQRRLASALLSSLDVLRLRGCGLESDAAAIRTALDRAVASAAQSGSDQVALALMFEVQNKADALLLELDRRENELALRRESARLALDAAIARLELICTDKDVTEIFARPLAVLRARLAEASAANIALGRDESVEFTRRLARWDAAVVESHNLQDEIERLYHERDQVVDKVRQRNRTVQAIIRSLMDLWGARFELDYMYAATDDPRSTLMIQTKRSHGRNVTVHLDLDGRMQISFTGYVGMECAKDLGEFQAKLAKAGELKLEQGKLHAEPDKPNPPGIDGGSGPVVYRPPAAASNAPRERKRNSSS